MSFTCKYKEKLLLHQPLLLLPVVLHQPLLLLPVVQSLLLEGKLVLLEQANLNLKIKQ
jgi:hypothetical protein